MDGDVAQQTYDVIVVGSGAAGLSAAVTAAIAGLHVLVLEKEPLYGGTTARSGGVLWVPGNGKFPHGESAAGGAALYLRTLLGANFDEKRVAAFLSVGPEMVSFMESRTSAVRFQPAHGFSDYHPDVAGAVTSGRSVVAEPYDGRALGREVARLRPPLAEITLLGMMLNASVDVKHFFSATKSLKSLWHVTKLLSRYGRDLITHRRAMRLTNGNALVARLARSAFDLGVEIRTDTAVRGLERDGSGRIAHVLASSGGQSLQFTAKRGVVLATGGFPLDMVRRKGLFPHERNGGEHLSPAAPGNTGDGIGLGESVGGQFNPNLPNAAAWIPVSRVPDERRVRVFPHLIDRYKPGVIMVNTEGRRFVNESESYHVVGQAMLKQTASDEEVAAWLIADHRAIRLYGLGFAKPAPLPLGPALRSGYLQSGNTVAELAARIGVEPAVLEQTLYQYNESAVEGRDAEFGRGSTAYNRFLGDPEHHPNPCVAPLARAPYYALRVVLGDLGTFAGLRTDEWARVLDQTGNPICGLYAVGNDASSIMGGHYPGGGITLGPAMTFGYIAANHLAAMSEGHKNDEIALLRRDQDTSCLRRDLRADS